MLKTEEECKYKNTNIESAANIEVSGITTDKIKEALQKSNNGRAAAPANIPMKQIKYGSEILLETIAGLISAQSIIRNHMNLLRRLYDKIQKQRIEKVKSIIETEEQMAF